MAAIGSLTVINITGAVQRPSRAVDLITRPNIDGISFRVMHARGVAFPLQAVVDATDANVQTKLTAFRAMRSTQITVIENNGKTHTDVLVLDVQLQSSQITASVGGVEAGAGTHRIVANLTAIIFGSA